MRGRPSAPPLDPRFALRIRELVIDGFSVSEARAIGAAFEQELGRILADGTPPFADRRPGAVDDRVAVNRLEAGTLTHPEGVSPQGMGQAAARAIVRRLRTLATGHGSGSAQRGRA
jgi:hypothetical protein